MTRVERAQGQRRRPPSRCTSRASNGRSRERGDYPADVSKLRKLLLALSDAKIVEEKTSNPANFSIIGVEDPDAAGRDRGARSSVIAQDGKHAVIVGKPVGEGNFVRRAGENTQLHRRARRSPSKRSRAFWIDIAAARRCPRQDSKHRSQTGGGTVHGAPGYAAAPAVQSASDGTRFTRCDGGIPPPGRKARSRRPQRSSAPSRHRLLERSHRR